MPISLDDQFKHMEDLIQKDQKFLREKASSYSSSFAAKVSHDIEIKEAIKETVREARQAKSGSGMGGKPIISEADEIRDALAKLDGDPPYHGSGNVCLHDGIYMKSIERKFGATITELREKVRK